MAMWSLSAFSVVASNTSRRLASSPSVTSGATVQRHPERTWLDCFVAFGVDRDAIRSRRCYYTWKTGKAPDFVLEIRTPTRDSADDGESAWRLYPALGITEYWIVDTAGAGSGRRGLRGNRLVDGRYEKTALVTEAAGAARGYSPTLGLGLSLDGDRLRLLDPTAGNCALSVIEEREARLAAEAENRQLREQLQRVNREHGQLRDGPRPVSAAACGGRRRLARAVRRR